MIRAYHARTRRHRARTEVLVPDSSHGTNPATASMAGYTTITIPSAADGGVDIDAFRAALGPRTAAVMITNPSTLGLFESRIGELLDGCPRGRRPRLHGRRQPQRHPWPVQARRGRLRRDALQRPQDVQHAPRRWRSRGRARRRRGEARAVPAGTRASCARTTVRYRLETAGRATAIDRPPAQLRRQHGRPRARVRLHPGARRVRAARGQRRRGPRRELPASTGWRAPTTCPTTGRASTSSSRRRRRSSTRPACARSTSPSG